MELIYELLGITFATLFVGVIVLLVVIFRLNRINRRFDEITRMLDDVLEASSEIQFECRYLHGRVGRMECRLGHILKDVKDIHEAVVKPTEEPAPNDDEEPELPIHLITAGEYYFQSGCTAYTLMYHVPTNAVRYYTSELDFIEIDNVNELIGDGLMFFGINDKEPDVVYVRNHNFNADFRIQRWHRDE